MPEAKDEFIILEIVGNNVSSKIVLTILVGIGSVSQDTSYMEQTYIDYARLAGSKKKHIISVQDVIHRKG